MTSRVSFEKASSLPYGEKYLSILSFMPRPEVTYTCNQERGSEYKIYLLRSPNFRP